MTLGSRIAAALVGLPGPRRADVRVERDLRVPMPDGVELLADRWFPAEGRVRATVLVRSPYGRRVLGPLGRLYAERGYQVVLQSCRGTFGSGGTWSPMRHEREDGRATVDWVGSRPWFDGRLVTWGASYLGLTQWALAEDAPASLEAVNLQVTASSFRDAVVFPAGSFALETAVTWLHQLHHQEEPWPSVLGAQARSAATVRRATGVLPVEAADRAAVGRPVPFYREWLDHAEPGDPWWDPVDFGRDLRSVPPASMVAGWYDIFLAPQLADYVALRQAGRTARLTVGPWTHTSPGLLAEAVRDGPAWWAERFESVLEPRAPVRLFVMGSGTWEDFSVWPPAGEEQRWYLGRSGTLRHEVVGDGPPDRYRYDPADPTPAVGGASLNARTSGRKNQRAREERADVVTYTGPVLGEDLTVIGPVGATVHLRSSLEHTDFFVRLCDVDAKGRSCNVCDGLVHCTPAGPGPARAGDDGTFAVEVSLGPTAHTFRAGHRVRLQVSSGAHPLFARNAGTGEPLGRATRLEAADQEVLHDADHPSHLTLHVVRLLSDPPPAARGALRRAVRRAARRRASGRAAPTGPPGALG